MGMKTNASEMLIASKDVPGPGIYSPKSDAFSTIAFSYAFLFYFIFKSYSLFSLIEWESKEKEVSHIEMGQGQAAINQRLFLVRFQVQLPLVNSREQIQKKISQSQGEMFQVQDLTRVIIKCLQETILNLFLVQLIEIKTLFMILILR